MSHKYVLGLDYGTESGRALLVAIDNGEEVATAVESYAHGVIDDTLPGTGARLGPDWALQHPQDYLDVLERIVPQVLKEAGVDGKDVIGIGTDFTACTLIPVDKAGTPLCLTDEFKTEPQAWVKLWKHHAAQPQADRITKIAEERNESFLPTYGGKISSEWLFSKALEVLEDAPQVYAAADRFIEAGDWLVLTLCGEEKRNACAAGYKAMWDESYPTPEFLGAVHPELANIVAEKMADEVYPAGVRAGGLLPDIAKKLGLNPGTAVATGGIDAHVAVPGTSVTQPGQMVMIMGTSLCHMVCGEKKAFVEGVAGVVKDGILPGYYGYEAGQAAVGDIFAWFINNCVPASATDAARAANQDIHDYLAAEAAKLNVGESGVLCLDWWNGNRSVLVDTDLTGLMVGMTLSTTPAEMYRAVLESTAFGTYTIISHLEAGGVPIDELYACGGLPGKNPLLMQIFADVTNREIKVAASDQAVALGAAMWGAVAAGAGSGGFDTITDAAAKMARLRDTVYRPNVKAHAAYELLFVEYTRLHDLFGRGGDDVMRTLKSMKRKAMAKS